MGKKFKTYARVVYPDCGKRKKIFIKRGRLDQKVIKAVEKFFKNNL